MQRKQRGYHPTAAGKASRLSQHPEQQQGIQDMQQHIRLVVAGGVGLKKLVVQGVREPGEWMPVSSLGGGERPLHRVPIEARLHLLILGYINVVIVVDEWVTANRVVQRNRRQNQQKAERPSVPLDPMWLRGTRLRCHLRCRVNRCHSFSLSLQAKLLAIFGEVVLLPELESLHLSKAFLLAVQ